MANGNRLCKKCARLSAQAKDKANRASAVRDRVALRWLPQVGKHVTTSRAGA